MNKLVNDYVNNIFKPVRISRYRKTYKDFGGDIIKKTYSFVTSKYIRKSTLNSDSRLFILNYISRCFEEKIPIRFNMLFGGYKLWHLESSPGVSWSEVFHLDFIVNFTNILSDIYPFGVDIVYRSDSPVIGLIDGYPEADIKIYVRQFKKLIRYFNSKLENNLSRISFETNLNNYKYIDLIDEMNATYMIEEAKFNSLSSDDQNMIIEKSFRNYFWKGLAMTKKIDKAKISAQAYIRDISYIKSDMKLDRDNFMQSIPVVFRRANQEGFVHYATVPSSIVQFWVGEGALKITEKKIVSFILSRKQLESSSIFKIILYRKYFPKFLPNYIYIINE